MQRRVMPENAAALRRYRDADVAWIGAANAPSSRPPNPPSCLNLEQALELAVIGIAMVRPLSPESIAELLRRIMPPPLQPTLDVVETRLRDLARRGLVVIAVQEAGPTLVRRSAAGVRYARALMRLPGPTRVAAHYHLAFMLRVCLLDVLPGNDRPAVLAELRRELQIALATAEEATRDCRSTGAHAHHWLERQVSRLRDDIRWLDELAAGPPG
jgi:hypothetical protein